MIIHYEYMTKYKVGDKIKFIDKPGEEIEILSKKGADALNKNNVRFYSDFEKITKSGKQRI